LKIDVTKINQHRQLLENHSLLVTNTIQTINDLRTFMEYHVFAVWDFMSLVKTLQHNVCPSTTLWVPTKGNRNSVARLINEIVLGEESDVTPDGQGSISHFDLYLQAMLEVGADISKIQRFLDTLNTNDIPRGSREFVESTLSTIKQGPHCAAASFCFGRETVIPAMFKRILKQLDISSVDAPKFHYYLERHIELDGGDHGPKAEHMLEYFCDNNPILSFEAEQAAVAAIEARMKLFDFLEAKLV